MGKDEAYRLIRACCASLDEAAALLQSEPSLLTERTGLGETPLHYLAVEDEIDAVRFLHERGADLNVRNDFGDSPLAEALSLGNTRTALFLLITAPTSVRLTTEVARRCTQRSLAATASWCSASWQPVFPCQ